MHISIAIRLAAILAMASAAEAQISAVPRRRRTTQEFGMERQLRGQQRERKLEKEKFSSLQQLEYDTPAP